jgi:hypothetical protein
MKSDKFHISRFSFGLKTLCGLKTRKHKLHLYYLDCNMFDPIYHMKKSFNNLKPEFRCEKCYNILLKLEDVTWKIIAFL